MDTSSYGQGAIVGGILVFPSYDLVPKAITITQEEINFTASPVQTFFLRGSVTPQVTGAMVGGVNRNFPGQ